MNEHVGVTLDVLPGTLGGITAALGGFNELVAATSMLTSKIAQSTSATDAMLLTIGVGIAGLAYESSKAAGELEKSMKIVQSVSGQTSTEIGVLTQKANELSVKYKMGIDDITNGLQTLGRAGLSSVNTQLDTMKAGLEAAKVTGMQLDDVLNKIIQTTSLLGGDINSSAFGQQSQALTSKILATSQSAPIDMNDVVQTLSYSGGTAAAGGINIEHEDALYDYLGAIAAFGQKGVSGSMAGTALRAFFTKPASQTSSVTEALGQLGMKPSDLWEPGEQAMRPVSEQIGLIQKQMDKLKISQLDQIELWGKIVSPKMGQQMLKLNKQSIQELSEKIRETDSAEKLAQNTMNNYISDLNTLSQQGQLMWREYGEAALAWLGPMVKGLGGLMNLLQTDVGGFPIFQQFVKGTIIIVISQIIQRLGSVWGLIKGIASEIKAQLSGFSQVRRTAEQTEQDLIRQYETMGLTESQAKTLAKESQNIHSGFSASNKVLGEFLAKLNEAVALMGRLSSLSQVNSMKMIGNMTGAQYTKFYGKASDYNKGAWYSHAYSRGDLTKTDFAKLSLRHGISQHDLQQIYYGTHETHKAGLYNYALANQTGFAKAMEKGQGKGFITATTFEKYLQANKMGLYDPKTNPMMAVVEHISMNTDKIAGTSSSGGQKNSVQEKSATATNNAQNNKTAALQKETQTIEQNIGKITKEGQVINEQIVEAEAYLAKVREEKQVAEQQVQAQKKQLHRQRLSDTGEKESTKQLLKQAEKDLATATEEEAATEKRIAALKTERAATEQQINALTFQKEFAAINSTSFANQLIKTALEEERRAIQEKIALLRKERIPLLEKLTTQTEAAALQAEIDALLAEDRALRAEIEGIDKAILEKRMVELATSGPTRSSGIMTKAGSGTTKTGMSITDLGKSNQVITPSAGNKFGLRQDLATSLGNASNRVTTSLNNFANRIRSAMGKTQPLGPTGLVNAAKTQGPIYPSVAGGVAASPSFRTAFMGSYNAGISGMRNYNTGSGAFRNWFWNAGLMQMVDRDAIKKSTANMGKLGKVAGVAGGALGGLSLMFGPIEMGMMAISMIMQGLQTAYQNYQKELEEINSALAEARENIKEAEDAFLEAYENANPKATQDEKDEALLDAYAGDTSASKDDGLQSYRDRLYGQVSAIEVNTRQKAEKEQHSIWGESGDWEKYFGGRWKAAGGLQSLIPIIGQMGAADARYSGDTFKEWREKLEVMNRNAETLELSKDRGTDTSAWGSIWSNNGNFGYDANQLNSAESMANNIRDSFDISIEKLDGTLNHYPDWIAQMDDKSDNAKYARSIMAEGIDRLGPTQNDAYKGIWGSSNNVSQYYKMQSEAMQLSNTEKTRIMNAINDDADFFKQMQKTYFKDSKNGKLVGRDDKTEQKILRAIQHRLGNISSQQAKIAFTLAAVSEIQKVVSEQVQPTLMSHMEAAWEGVNITSATGEKVGGTWSTTSAVQQGVAVISAQMARLLQQKAMELGSLQAEMAGIDMKDLDKLRQVESGRGATINGHGYTAHDVYNAKQIFSMMETSPYEAVALQRGDSADEAKAFGERMKKLLEQNGADALAIWGTQAKGLQYFLDPVITEAYTESLKDKEGKATGAESTGKDKDSSKDKTKDTSNKKNWVNLAICNKKEIPKLNVNLFKKPPNFTILNRNFKLRDVNVNTADDAKSIQNAVKNSIIEIQNRSNPKIIQDDAAEYDPVNATEGNNIPTGTKKTE